MRNRLIVVSLATLCLSQPIGHCGESQEEAELLAADRKWAELAAAGDVEGVLSGWADDAVVYFPGRPTAVGKQAIHQIVKANRAVPGFSLTWKPADVEVSRSNDMGHTRGSFQMTLPRPDGGLMTKTGDYVCIWQRQGDLSWKCTVEISRFHATSAGRQRQPITERNAK